jgi:radical SAM superfamily enzyme YgiQ (UPF0313 family)
VLALLVSTYELGRQPFGLASPAAWLRRDGVDVQMVDTAKEKLPVDRVRQADLIAVHLPMHTATRLAVPLIEKMRRINPTARLCAYGLYAPLNADWLRALGVDEVLGGEFEGDLAEIAREVAERRAGAARTDGSFGGGETRPPLPRLQFLVPDRTGLPPLSSYATLQVGHERLTTGYTEASRGCRHLCRHCPVVPVYNGQFRIVQPDVVLADVAAQVAAGARHITFGDPDFFNGPRHALRIVEAFHDAHPTVTYDVTIKVEHLLQHRDVLGRLRDTGCLFVTSAVESLDDRTLELLDKGHTRRDVLEAVALCRLEGLTLVPTFVAFHPWQTLEGYCDLLRVIESEDLVDHVAPIQLAIRLLIPQGSRLLETEEMRRLPLSFDAATLAHRWAHPDPRVDALHDEVSTLIGSSLASDRREVFEQITRLAHARAGLARPAVAARAGEGRRASAPYLSEPWYCCAEPNPDQLHLL